jgi:hypothetical protein
MISYNVFFTPKAGVEDAAAVAAVRRFLETLRAGGRLHAYRILRVTNSASFPALPRFQVIADYTSQAELDVDMAFMGEPGRVMTGPHGGMVALVGEFKVSFTADA